MEVQKKLITRRFTDYKNKVTLETISHKETSKWFNSLYLSFIKKNFINFKYPRIKTQDNGRLIFCYWKSDFGKIECHGGVTFYEETFIRELSRTVVKIGCNYQHLHDDFYMAGDHGKMILENDGPEFLNNFLELANFRNENK